MATDERNFRSTYYEKVGFKSVEEKKSLEILLKDKPLDKGKLKQFCLRYCVPTAYRNLLWKLLLDVVPVHIDCHTFIMSQRKQEFSDLKHALYVMKVVDCITPKPQVFLAMWLLQTGNFTFELNLQEEKCFVTIVQALLQFFDDEIDVYWLAKKFHDNISRFEHDFPKLIDTSCVLLEKEEPILYKHLQMNAILDNLPVIAWFRCGFAGIINNDSALGKIWDKICGGSCKILVFVLIVLLSNLKHRLMKCNDLGSCLQYIKSISEETSDGIVNKSIDMWQQQGSPLTVHDKPKP